VTIHADNQPTMPDVLPLAPARPRRRRRAKPASAFRPRQTSTLRLPHYLATKVRLEFALAFVLAVLAAPIILFTALLVKLTSRGPAFYTQVRVGRNGRPFTIYKLRTMIHDCESLTGPRWAIRGDPRVTRLGYLLRASHLDELPQLFNVLRGDMALIGPRPERPEFVRQLEVLIPSYRDRQAIRPGVTGLAQVQLSADTDINCVRRKLLYDLHYIKHLNLWMDLRILLATLVRVLGNPFGLTRQLSLVPSPEQVERVTAEATPPARAKLSA
jgi:lipopolysaccharide/colanic/teichoic acid biosynthesis glycosyltransferase